MSRREAQQRWRQKHPGAYAEQLRRYRRKLRHDALQAYGGQCVDCSETDEDALELDHADGGGNTQRDEIFGHGHASPGGWMFYLWLRKHGYPQNLGLQCRCRTCHDRKHGRSAARLNCSPAMDPTRTEIQLTLEEAYPHEWDE